MALKLKLKATKNFGVHKSEHSINKKKVSCYFTPPRLIVFTSFSNLVLSFPGLKSLGLKISLQNPIFFNWVRDLWKL